MKADSSSSTTDRGSTERKLAVLREAARRADWDATRGPEHLRSGRYQPVAMVDETPLEPDAAAAENATTTQPPAAADRASPGR
jgi:hypothetical protein